MKMLSFVVALLCTATVFRGVISETTNVAQCTSNPGDLPINAYIEGCTNPPCVLPQLQDCVIHIVFRAPRTMRSMTTLATAFMSIGPITLPINYDLQENAITCNFLTNSYCPVLETEVLQYTLRMYIESFFPAGTQVTIEFRVVDEDTQPVLCLRVPVQIVPPIENRSALTNTTLFIDSISR